MIPCLPIVHNHKNIYVATPRELGCSFYDGIVLYLESIPLSAQD